MRKLLRWIGNSFSLLSRRSRRGSAAPSIDLVLVMTADSREDQALNVRVAERFAFMASLEAFACFFGNMKEKQAAISRGMDVCESEGVSIEEAFKKLGIEWDSSLLAQIAALTLTREKAVDHMWNLHAQVLIEKIRPGQESDREAWDSVSDAIELFIDMGTVLGKALEEPPDEFDEHKVESHCLTLSHRLAQLGKYHAAIKTLVAGINSLCAGAPATRMQLAKRIFSIAVASEDQELLAASLTCVIALATSVGSADAEAGRWAMDIVLDIALLLSAQPRLKDRVGEILGPYYVNGCQPALRAYLRLFDPSLDRSKLPKSVADARVVPQLAPVALDSWVPPIIASSMILTEIENSRLLLEPAPRHFAITEWASRTFEIPAFLRAVPYADSIMKTEDAPQLLSVLKHELVHVICLDGGLGVALSYLRGANVLVERALKLGCDPRNDKSRNWRPDRLIYGKRLEHTFENLAPVAAQLECLRKVQILQDVWSPWFEGVAVFAEVHAVPGDVAATWSDWTLTIPNLVDNFEEGQISGQLPGAAGQWRQEFEGILETTAASQGSFSLRAYLCTYHRSYLAGYLAARAVVSSWRSTSDVPLSGEIAARLLTDLSRKLSHLAIPNLDQSIADFERSCVERMIEWVENISRLSKQTIDSFRLSQELDSAQERSKAYPFSYENNEALQANFDWKLRQIESEIGEILLRQFHSSTEHRKCAWDAIGDNFSTEELNEICSNLWRSQTVLPIGEVNALFWLNTQCDKLFIFMRTREVSRETGAPAYRPLILGLSTQERIELERQVQSLRETRIRVLRVVDMAHHRPTLSDRSGFHYMVLHYGEFVMVRPLGIVAGRSSQKHVDPTLLEDIRKRLLDPDVELDHVDIGGDLMGPGARDKFWLLDEEMRKLFNGNATEDVESLIRLSFDVVEAARGDIVVDVSSHLLALCVEQEDTRAMLHASGLEALSNGSSESLRDILSALHSSGRIPRVSTGGSEESLCKELFEVGRHGLDVRPIRAASSGFQIVGVEI